MADVTTLQSRLTEAEAALHKLETGARVVATTGPDGSSVQFQPGESQRLQQYIDRLRQMIENATRPRGPIYPIF